MNAAPPAAGQRTTAAAGGAASVTLHGVDRGLRLRLHLLPLVAVFFLSIYGREVCPLIAELSLGRVSVGLAVVALLHLFLREVCWNFFSFSRRGYALGRHAYRLSVATWLGAGVIAMAMHAELYPDFPLASHLKLLSGYWGLGAGILAQLEYVLVERYVRVAHPLLSPPSPERITARLMQGLTLFTLVPVVTMVLMNFRFVSEGYANSSAAYEVLFLGGSFVLSTLVVSWFYGRALRQDCDNLLVAVRQIADGRFQVNVDPSRGDELGRVAHGINAMAHGLLLRERIRDAFGRFVNPQVAEALIERFSRGEHEIRMGGERREVTILMVDLRSFTPLAERLAPEVLTALLNAYFSRMVGAIQAQGGMVDKFIGDAIMAVFGLTEGTQDHAVAAVAAALEMRVRLAEFNAAHPETPLENGVGIHTGGVVAGYFGSSDRLEFTVIGHAVNLAARIESQAKAPQPPVLFSAAVAKRVAGHFGVREVVTVSLKGIAEPVALYTVTDG
ncbi:MAG: adenylate/guanylate cyclase domain-containing protein [Magnetococcales bacterium]|nr:adenylate/guanylate cyclase domain-containing protein [Magnetococcales bacterium]